MSAVGRSTPKSVVSTGIRPAASAASSTPPLGSELLAAALAGTPAAAPSPAEEDGSDVVSLVQRALKAWTDEFTLFVQTHVGAVSAVKALPPAHLPVQSPLACPPVIAPSATLLVRLPALLAKLRAQAVISRANYLERVGWAAAQLRAVQQDAAAKLCYENYMEQAALAHAQRINASREAARKKPLDDTVELSPSSEDGATTAGDETIDVEAPILRGAELAAHVTALFGLHACSFRLLIARDPLLSSPPSLPEALSIVARVESALDSVLSSTEDEREMSALSYLLFNGCLLAFQMLEPLAAFGHGGEARPHVQHALAVLESQATLCGVRFLPFRLQLYCHIARSFESEGDWARARAAMQRGLDKVRELASWEAVAQPVPARTGFLLRQAAQALSNGIVKYAYLQGQLSEQDIESKLMQPPGGAASASGAAFDPLAGLTLLLELLSDPQCRTLDTFFSTAAAQLDCKAEQEKRQAERKKREEEVQLQVAQEALHAAAAQQQQPVGAKTPIAGAISAGGKGRKNQGGALSSEAILAAAAAAAAAMAQPVAATTAGGATDRSPHRRSGGGAAAGNNSNSNKKKQQRPGSGHNSGDESDETTAAAAAAAAFAAEQPRDVRSPRAVTLVRLALRRLEALLSMSTPLVLLEAQALGLAGPAASLSELLDPQQPQVQQNDSKGKTKRNDADAQPVASSSLIAHDLPGDWLPLSLIFSVARAAFAAGCFAEFQRARECFLQRAQAGNPLCTAVREEELRADRSAPSGTGMEVSLELLARLLPLLQAHGGLCLPSAASSAGALGSVQVDVPALHDFAAWLGQVVTAAKGSSSGASSNGSISQATSDKVASRDGDSLSASPFPASACFQALSKFPDLWTDAGLFLWRFFLQPLLRIERAPSLDLPLALLPPAAVEARAPTGSSQLESPGSFDPACEAALRAGLQALTDLLLRLQVSDVTLVGQVVLELVQLLRQQHPPAAYEAGATQALQSPSDPADTHEQPEQQRLPLANPRKPGAAALTQIVAALTPAVAYFEAHLGEVLRRAGSLQLGGTLHSIVARFDGRVEQVVSSATSPDDAEQNAPDSAENARPLAGPLSRTDATAQCVYADLLLQLYDAQLRLGLLHARAQARRAHGKVVADLESKYALTATYRKAAPPLLLPPFSAATEKALEAAAGANVHRRALLTLAMLPYRPTVAAQQEFYDKRVTPALEAVRDEETALLRDAQLHQVNSASNVGGGAFRLDTRFGSRTSLLNRQPPAAAQATQTQLDAAAKRAARGRLPPPRLVSRSANSLVLRPVVSRAFQRLHQARGVILFGKASDTGIDVSTGSACTEFYPLGIEVPLPALPDECTADSDDAVCEIPAVELLSLPANTPFVFACICVDYWGQFIGAIGDTSGRIATALPVARAQLQAYAAHILRCSGDRARLEQEAAAHAGSTARDFGATLEESKEQQSSDSTTALSSSGGGAGEFAFVRSIQSLCWRVLSPFVRIRAQASHRLRLSAHKQKSTGSAAAARTLGDGDRINLDKLGTYSDEEEEEEDEHKSNVGPYANRTHTGGAHDSYTLGPAAADAAFRLDGWQLAAPLLHAAPRPLLYQLAATASMHADCLALGPLVPANSAAAGASLATRPLALLQLRALEVVRSLQLALQLSLALEDWRSGAATAVKFFDALQPLLDGFVPHATASLGTSTAASTLALTPLLALFQALVLLRSRLSYSRVTPALQRCTARVLFALVRGLEARSETALLAHVLSQYETLCSATHAAAQAEYSAAALAYRARQAAIDLAKLRAAQLREALQAEAAAEQALREQQAGKEASKAARKKAGGGSASTKKKGNVAASPAESPAAAEDASVRQEAKEDGGDTGADGGERSASSAAGWPVASAALPLATSPAIESILCSPLLHARAGHRPAPADYFRLEAEERSLVTFLASRGGALGETAARIAQCQLGRMQPPPGAEDDEQALALLAPASGNTAASVGAGAASAASSSSGATGEEGSPSLASPSAGSGGKRRRGGAAEEEAGAMPLRSRSDIELALFDALARARATPPLSHAALAAAEAGAAGGASAGTVVGSAPAAASKDGSTAPASSTVLSPLLTAFHSLRADWSAAHPRWTEVGVRLARAALERGEVAAARTILEGVDDLAHDFAQEQRLRTPQEEESIQAARLAAMPPAHTAASDAAPAATDAAAAAESAESRPATPLKSIHSGTTPSHSPERLGTAASAARPQTGAKSPGGGGRPAAPGTPAKPPSRRERERQAAAQADAAAAAQLAKPQPPFTATQLRWLAEAELLRAHVASIALEIARQQSAHRSAVDHAASSSGQSALGWEVEAERASKLRPATTGMLQQQPSASAGSSNSPDAASPERVGRLRFPPLTVSPRSGGAKAASSSMRSVLFPPALSGRSLSQSPGRSSGAAGAAGGRRMGGAAAAQAALAEEARVAAEQTAAAEAARRSDPALLELERFRRLGRAAWLAHRAQAWGLLQALGVHVLNALQTGSVKYSPADFAVRCFHLASSAARQAHLQASSAGHSGILLTNSPSTVACEQDKAAEHFATPLAVLDMLAGKLIDMLQAMKHAAQQSQRAEALLPKDVNALHLQLWRDVPAVAEFLAHQSAGTGGGNGSGSSAAASADLWFLSLAGLSVLPVVRLLRFTVASLFHAQRWAAVLRLSAASHAVFAGAFAEGTLKYAIYAAEETRHRAHSLAQAKAAELATLQQSFEHDARLIAERREQRRSQRGKREEEERLEMLRALFEQRRAPLQAEWEGLDAAFRTEDATLTAMRAACAAALLRAEPKHARALLHARCKLLTFYNDLARSGSSGGAGQFRTPGSLLADEPLDAVSESRAASRPVSRGGSVRDSELGEGMGGANTATDDDDLRSLASMTSLGSALGGGTAAGGYSQAMARRARKQREKGIVAVAAAYQKAISSLRAASTPEASLLLARALHEAADFAWAEYSAVGRAERRDNEPAALWHEALDQCFGALGAVLQRRTLVLPFETPSGLPPLGSSAGGEGTLLAQRGFWGCVSGLMACAKLARLSYAADANLRREVVLIGAALARALFHCSLAHPATDRGFAAYSCEALWGAGAAGGESGGLAELLGADPLRARAQQLLESLELLGSELVRFQCAPLRALPVLTLYEHVARRVCRSPFHTAWARVLKARACLDAGLLTEASLLYIALLEGVNLPRAAATGLSLRAHAAALPQPQAVDASRLAPVVIDKKKGGSSAAKASAAAAAAAAEAAGGSEPTEAERAAPLAPFHAHYPPLHPLNRGGFVSYLLAEGPRAAAAHAPTSALAALYGGFVWTELRTLRADFLCALAGRSRDQLSPLLDTALWPAAAAAAEGSSGDNAAGGGSDGSKRAGLNKRSSLGSMPAASGGSSAERPRSRDSNRSSPVAAPVSLPPSLAEKLHFRSLLLRAAEKIHAETVALFLPRDPSGKEDKLLAAAQLPVAIGGAPAKGKRGKVANAAEPAAAARAPSPNGEDASALAAQQQLQHQQAMANRRRTTMNFAELLSGGGGSGSDPVGGSGAGGSGLVPASFPAGLALNTGAQGGPTAFEQAGSTASGGSLASAELLAALTRDTTVLPSAVVCSAYLALSSLKAAAGHLSDAVYFAKRCLRVMQEAAGSEIAVDQAQQQQQQQEQQQAAAGTSSAFAAASSAVPSLGALPSARPRSPVSSRSPSKQASPRQGAAASGQMHSASLQQLARERAEKFAAEAAAGSNPAAAAAAPASASAGPAGLLSVPPSAGAAPLSWRQLLDARQWLRARLHLASLLLQQGRHAACGEQLLLADSEAARLKDPLALHQSALLASWLLAAEGKFLPALHKLSAAVWVDPSDAELAARKARLAKLPGGEAALPPEVPRPPTYAVDHGQALLQLLHLLRRLPAQDFPDAAAAQGRLHSAAILTHLERISADALEAHGLRPSDLALAEEVLPSAELRQRSAASLALAAGGQPRPGQSLPEQRLAGVVSLYHPFVPHAMHAHFLAAKHALASLPTTAPPEAATAAARLASKHALLAERLLVLCGPSAPPASRLEVAALVAKVSWRRVREQWAGQPLHERDLNVGVPPEQADAEEAQARAALALEEARAAALLPGNALTSPTGKSGRTSRAASPAQPKPAASLSVNTGAAVAGEQQQQQTTPRSAALDSASQKRRSRGARDLANAAAAAAAAAGAQAAQAEAAEVSAGLAALASNPLSSAAWEEAAGALPKPIHSREPRSLRAILARLHRAVQIGLLHGAQHARVRTAAALLVDIHCELRDIAQAKQQHAAAQGEAYSLRPFLQPAFHAALAAYWLSLGARVGEALQFLQRHAVDSLAATPLPPLSGGSSDALAASAAAAASAGGVPLSAQAAALQPFPLASHLQAELVEAHRLRAERRKQELAFLLAGQADAASSGASTGVAVDSAFGGTGGAGSRKEKADSFSGPSGSAALSRRGGAGRVTEPAPVGSDDALSSRSLLLQLLALRAETRARHFESELLAACSAEESLAVDAAAFLAGFAPYAERVNAVKWDHTMEVHFGAGAAAASNVPAADAGAVDNNASLLSAVHASLEDGGALAPGSVEALWSSRAAWELRAPRTDAAASKSEPLSLALLLSTDVARGGASAGPLSAAAAGGAGAGGKSRPLKGSGGSTSPSNSRKKKGSSAPEDGSSPPRAALFGASAPRFETLLLRVSPEAVTDLAARTAALRYAVQARLAAAQAASGGGAGGQQLQPHAQELHTREQEAFFALLVDLEAALGSLRPAAAALASPASPSSPPRNSSESEVAQQKNGAALAASSPVRLASHFASEYGLPATLAELSALESLLDRSSGSGSGGACRLRSNGLALLLHHCSTRSVDAMARQAAAAETAAALEAANAVVAAPAAHKGKAAEREALKAAAKAEREAAAVASTRTGRSATSSGGRDSPSADV